PDTYIDVKINLEKKTPVPSEDKLLVFPNPAKDVVNLHFNGKNLIKGVKVFDQQGLMVDSNLNLSQASYAVNTSSYPNGIYIFQVVTTDGVITKKVSVLTK
ncbi:MAG: T9SS type A sorting domain-containing protein, partial [Saprospiraceae bacterium]|nr:T9SS type A sorting domain-containing protein [Saprospiraceae bacterium]